MAVIPFIGPTFQDQSVTADNELCMNWYVEVLDASSKPQKAILLPRPGVSTFCTLPTFPVRGEFSMQGRSFFVGGDTLYELTINPTDDWLSPTRPTGTATNRGTLATGVWPATICSNGDGGGQLFITSGNNGYIYDLSANTLTLVVAAADMGFFLGGYFGRLDFSSSTFALSALEDGTTWDPTMFAQRSLAADPWVSCAVFHGELWLLGEQTSEVWQNIGGSSAFPFAPIPGAFLEQGCAAPFTVARVGGSIAWLGQNDQGRLTVCRSSGYQAQKISTHAIDYAIQQVPDQEHSDAFAEQVQGHEFYVLNLPASNQTWAYDAVTGLWAQRGYWNQATATFEVARPQVHSVAFGYTLVGDRVTGDVLVQDIAYPQDTGGVAIRRVRRNQTLTDEQHWTRWRSVQAVLDVGVVDVFGDSAYFDVIQADVPTNYFRFGETGFGPFVFKDTRPTGATIAITGTSTGQPGLVHDDNLAYVQDDGPLFQTITGLGASGTTFTLEVSIKPDAEIQETSDVGGIIAGNAGGAIPGYGLVYDKVNQRLGYDKTAVAPFAYWTTPIVQSGGVYHIIVSVTAGVGTLYLNGMAYGTISGIPSLTPIAMGHNEAAPGFGNFGGTIDEFSYYVGRALTPAEALAHYEATLLAVRDAQLMHRFSKDNGRTWSVEDWRSAGRQGAWATRAIWRQQGRARTRMDELVCTDGTPWRIVEFIAEMSQGTGA